MTALSAFRPSILPFVRDCADLAADITARFAMREFCRKTDWLMFEHDPITLLAGVAEYELEPPPGTNVVAVVEATIENRTIEAMSRERLVALYGDWRDREGTVRGYTQLTRTALRLVPIPDTKIASGLKLVVSLEPAVDSIAVDDSLYERWAEVIGYGARARLKDMPGQPYYDPAGSKVCRDYFDAGIQEAKLERQRGLTRTVKTVQMRQWV